VENLFSHLCGEDLFSHLDIRSEVMDLLASFHTCVDRSEATLLFIGRIRVSAVGRHVSISYLCGG
jgi:hypothetical protein